MELQVWKLIPAGETRTKISVPDEVPNGNAIMDSSAWEMSTGKKTLEDLQRINLA